MMTVAGTAATSALLGHVGDLGVLRLPRRDVPVRVLRATWDGTFDPGVCQVDLQIIDSPAQPGMDGPTCHYCGGMTRRTGTCATCTSCGETTGCG